MTDAPRQPTDGSPRSLWDVLLVSASFALLAVVGWVLLRRGINLSDEGFLLQQALDMLDGKVLYRDIEMFIAPGIWFVVAGLFSVIEPSVLASRVVAAISYFGLAVMIFKLVADRAGARYAAVTVGFYAVLAVWSFPHWTWAWYSPYAILFALLAMHSLLAWGESGRASLLVRVGLYVGLTTIFKQNYGFFALAACGLGIVAIRLEAKLRGASPGAWSETAGAIATDGLRVGAGLVIAVAPLLAYFGYHGALWSIYDRFVLYPLEFTTAANIPYLPFQALFQHGVFQDRITSTNYLAQLALNSPSEIALLPSLTAIHVLHALLYWMPPILMLAGLALSLFPAREPTPEPGETERSRLDVPLFVSTAVSALLFLGIFPRADYTHLVTVYQPLLVTGAFVAHRLAGAVTRRAPGLVWATIAAGTALFGFYALTATAWTLYLNSAMTEKLPQPRGGVLVHVITAVGVNQLVEVVRAHTKEGDAFFGIPDMAMINFLAERDVPGSQYQTYAHMIARDEGALTTTQLAAADVGFVIARYDNVLSTEPRLVAYAPILSEYLDRHFEPTWLIQNDQYLLLERRSTPKPPTRTLEALSQCAFASGDAAPSSVRQHLLFASLFQPLEPNTPQQTAETHCRVHIPDEATALSFQLGYKRPVASVPGASVTGEVYAIHSAAEAGAAPHRELLFESTLDVESMNVDGVRVPSPERVDLRHLAGREITLAFRVERRGRVKLSPFTLETYAVFWQNPLLELSNP